MGGKAGKSGSRARLESIEVLAELQRIGWPYRPLSETEIKVKCPAHEDSTPSASMNVEARVWKCHASQCGAQGDIITLLAMAMKVDRTTMLVDLGTRYDVEEAKYIDPAVVERFTARLQEAGPLLKKLRDRGVTDEMMAEARLGYHDGRITIPIYDAQGRVVNVRRYLPGAPGHLKMQSTKGYQSTAIYRPRDLIDRKRVMLCGGEMKALVAGTMLRKFPDFDCGAISVTSGEGTWDHQWDKLLHGKELLICMDVDLAGRKASAKLAASLSRSAASVRIVKLPLDPVKYPKGDVNDWVGQEKATAEDLLRVLQEAPPFAAPSEGPAPDAPLERVLLRDSTDPSNVSKRLELEAVVTALETTPYLVPHRLAVTCSKDQPNCHVCPIHALDPDPDTGYMDAAIPECSTAVLELIRSPRSQQRAALLEGLRMPRCKVVDFTVKSHHCCRELRLTPQLTMRSEGEGNVVQPAISVGCEVDLNVPYVFRGQLHSHPKTHQATLVLNEASETQDSLSSFDPTDSELQELDSFSPREWTAPAVTELLAGLYRDIESNVTRIFGRPMLHRFIDLAYHSVLMLPYDGRALGGWVNLLIIGDSAQGKTEATTRTMEHYGLGERVDCKNASVAGLLGGLQQIGNQWFVSWGVIPTHDRRLVILEEVKGAHTEVLARLTDMRSSGIAEIPKIERRRAHARTRLIFVSNPRSSRPMSAFNFGIEAVRELIGGLEDVRRFDAAVGLASGAVSQKELSGRAAEKVPADHPAGLCRRLVMWAWTRKLEDVSLAPGTEQAVNVAADRLIEQYSESLPLVDRGTMRLKLARLSAALAARTFSRGETRRQLVVRPCHAEVVASWLQEAYDDPAFGYGEFSRAQRRIETIVDSKGVRRRIETTRNPRALAYHLLHRDEIALQDVQDLCELDRDNAQKVLSFFVVNHCLVRDGRQGYRKTPDFIELLRACKDDAPEPVRQVEEEPF